MGAWFAALLEKIASTTIGKYILSWGLSRLTSWIPKVWQQIKNWISTAELKKAMKLKHDAAVAEYEKIKNDPTKSAKEQEDAFQKFINDTRP